MTADEKKVVYNFLKTSSAWIKGYKDKDFDDDPLFEDDIIEYASADENPEPESKIQGSVPDTQSISAEDSPSNDNSEKVAETRKSVQETIQESIQDSNHQENAQTNNRGMNLEKLEEKIKACRNCVLSRQRTNAVTGDGVTTPLVLVIGEGPGDIEDKSGRAFSGPQGQLLDKMLNAICLDRKLNCYITNIVKCRPPMNRTPMPDEASSCSGFLQAQIHLLSPEVILCMGRTSFQNFLGTQDSLSTTRGKWLSYHGTPVMVTHSPQELLENNSLKAAAWNDLKMIRSYLQDKHPEYEEEYRNAKIH